MAYMVIDDYTRLIARVHLDEILAQAAESSGFTTDICLDNAFKMAQAEVKAYLNKLFDVAAEFALASGSGTRNENMIRAIIHIALFNLHFTINPHDVPEMRRKAYEALVGPKGELAAVRDGVLDWGLTEKAAEDTVGFNRTEINSATKFISKPYTDPQFQS